MNFLLNIGLLLTLGLAIAKLYDLCFSRKDKKDEAGIELQLDLMQTFMAEFTHKTMRLADEYEEAPEEIYLWLKLAFNEWAKSYIKRKEAEIKNENQKT